VQRFFSEEENYLLVREKTGKDFGMSGREKKKEIHILGGTGEHRWKEGRRFGGRM